MTEYRFKGRLIQKKSNDTTNYDTTMVINAVHLQVPQRYSAGQESISV